MSEYIHELPDWPDFHWSAALAAPLARAARRQGELIGRVWELGFTTDTDAAASIQIATITDDVVKTSAIEGETLNAEDVRSSVARRLGIDIGVTRPADRNIDGVVEMLLDADGSCHQPLTAERIWRWQTELFPTAARSQGRIVVGRWREGSIAVLSGLVGGERVHFEGPDASRVAGEMETFLDWFNAASDPSVDGLVKSGIAHLWFVTIHPLDDGNGRIARALTDMLLARSDNLPGRFYSLSSQMFLERVDYYNALESTQKQSTLDITTWLTWYLGCLERAIERFASALTPVSLKRVLWSRLSGVDVNDRQRAMLERLFGSFEGKLTAEKWAVMTKTSRPTALRDITELLAHGCL